MKSISNTFSNTFHFQDIFEDALVEAESWLVQSLHLALEFPSTFSGMSKNENISDCCLVGLPAMVAGS